MALSQAQLLRRKEKKHKARTEKAKSIDHLSQVHNLSQWPIVEAYAPFHSRDEHTMQYALIVRECPNGQWAVGLFLIDMLCLGVKDCFMKMMLPHQFGDFLEKLETFLPMDEVSPPYVATLVQKAVEYSKNLGFNPRGNYQVVKKFLEGIPLDPALTFTFGEDGKPVYIAGPRDSVKFSNKVLETLNKTVGEGHYKFMVPLGGHNEAGE